jgi:hypothetical protein
VPVSLLRCRYRIRPGWERNRPLRRSRNQLTCHKTLLLTTSTLQALSDSFIRRNFYSNRCVVCVALTSQMLATAAESPNSSDETVIFRDATLQDPIVNGAFILISGFPHHVANISR